MRLYVIFDKVLDEYYVTPSKEELNSFLEKREPNRYDWVKLKKDKDVKRTLRLLGDKQLCGFGDFALTYQEYYDLQDKMMGLAPCIISDLIKLMKDIHLVKFTEEEFKAVHEMIEIVYMLLHSIEEPPIYLDGVIDETNIFDEYLLAKKHFMEDCI